MSDTLESLRVERDAAREECGVLRYRMEHYEREMYTYLHKRIEIQKELDAMKATA